MKKNGTAVTEKMYRLNIAQKDEKQKQNKAFLQIVLDKTQQFKEQQEALIFKTIDEISKREKVLQMKVICPPFRFVYCIFSLLCLRNIVIHILKEIIAVIFER